MILIDGKKISLELQSEIAIEVKELIAKGKKQPHLAAILVGDDPASQTYVGSKVKACENVGFKSTLVKFEANVSEQQLLSKIEELNNDDDLDGYIVQLPLPRHISETSSNFTSPTNLKPLFVVASWTLLIPTSNNFLFTFILE